MCHSWQSATICGDCSRRKGLAVQQDFSSSRVGATPYIDVRKQQSFPKEPRKDAIWMKKLDLNMKAFFYEWIHTNGLSEGATFFAKAQWCAFFLSFCKGLMFLLYNCDLLAILTVSNAAFLPYPVFYELCRNTKNALRLPILRKWKLKRLLLKSRKIFPKKM